jgi:hypothetical protein
LQEILDRPALGATLCCPAKSKHFFPCVQSVIGTLSPRHGTVSEGSEKRIF